MASIRFWCYGFYNILISYGFHKIFGIMDSIKCWYHEFHKMLVSWIPLKISVLWLP